MTESLSEYRPPRHIETISIRYCPQCGADDRFTSLGTKRHYRGGRLCPGTPVKLVYRFERTETAE